MFKSRYIELKWWANVVYAVAEVLSRALTLGTQGVLDLGGLVLNLCKGRLLEDKPIMDVLETSRPVVTSSQLEALASLQL